MTDRTAAEAAHVRRMVPRIRRMLADAPEGVARAALRRKLNSREKHLYDAALDLLVAVGDVVALPAASGGTRYRLTESARQPQSEPPSR
ncbi:hypothetical protein Q9R08_04880 [Microbacterium sp. QXD-8]|uniref:DUF3253 domain-containing protein n=1 Tax=Microbacterium psychrotolerans TaxID=3068321 RepID=A0ABU0Z196_9MICO|nr:hypothetical protein [Microbacterium sp. QXD-8]MDQ7877306.1 hypothetical protein [Microbacterium sp. QXD-8]